MDLLITIAALLLLLGADREREAAFEPALQVNNNKVERKWRAIRRILSDTWIRCRAVAAGEEAIQ